MDGLCLQRVGRLLARPHARDFPGRRIWSRGALRIQHLCGTGAASAQHRHSGFHPPRDRRGACLCSNRRREARLARRRAVAASGLHRKLLGDLWRGRHRCGPRPRRGYESSGRRAGSKAACRDGAVARRGPCFPARGDRLCKDGCGLRLPARIPLFPRPFALSRHPARESAVREDWAAGARTTARRPFHRFWRPSPWSRRPLARATSAGDKRGLGPGRFRLRGRPGASCRRTLGQPLWSSTHARSLRLALRSWVAVRAYADPGTIRSAHDASCLPARRTRDRHREREPASLRPDPCPLPAP